MKRKLLRTKGDEWCEMKIEIEDGRLSVSGLTGQIVDYDDAKDQAVQYWESFFEECPEELGRMAVEHGTRTPEDAAELVLSSDGELHGLDCHKEVDGKAYLCGGAGQCWDKIKEFFPEAKPLEAWHLNDLNAGTEAQAAVLKLVEATADKSDSKRNHYDWACRALKEHGCLVSNGYKYGSGWLKRELPAEIVELAQSITA